MKITAVVPVRAGSRRLKNKNILPFADSNLLVHKIRQLKKVEAIDEIVVSSDSDEMLHMAELEGVSTHRREQCFADDKISKIGDVVVHICESLKCDVVLWTHCTSPMVSSKHYDDAIKSYYSAIENGYDSLMSFERLYEFLWDDTGPINYDAGSGQPRSQDLKPIYRYTSGIIMAPRDKMVEWHAYHGRKPYKFIVDKQTSVDIDDAFDLACARAYYEMGE